jgi:serine phosphatase RsbU (regulator of sigma subunit)
VEAASLVMPVSGATVGGDFHLIKEIGTRTVTVVGDVEGNGEDAAPYAERLCAELGQHVASERDPAQLLERLNSRAHDDPEFERYATACAVTTDRARWSARVRLSGAGRRSVRPRTQTAVIAGRRCAATSAGITVR